MAVVTAVTKVILSDRDVEAQFNVGRSSDPDAPESRGEGIGRKPVQRFLNARVAESSYLGYCRYYAEENSA